MQRLGHEEGHNQGGGDGAQDDGQAGQAHLADLPQVQPKPQEDDRVLQHLFGGEGHAVLHSLPDSGPVFNHGAAHHADEDGQHR